ncbi:DUF3883 domain-containing protein [Streptomyces sp. NPDC050095]|uniref:DUF3883 domain-containing protein n=1 Tax=unclassified Streptomyces TaxID=2593676 RepID=UPI00341DC6C8
MLPLANESTRRAAARWLLRLRVTDLRHTNALFTFHPEYSDLTPGQYAMGLAWLQQARLVSMSGRLLLPLQCEGESAAEEAVARIVRCRDLEELRRETGELGEKALSALLRQGPCTSVRRVSELSDAFGYDIEATSPLGSRLHVECKTTLAREELTLYLSRHEFETMKRDPAWILVAVLPGLGDVPEWVATVRGEWLRLVSPEDRQPAAKWRSARFRVPPEELEPGVRAPSGELVASVPMREGEVLWGLSCGAPVR